jgi:hypothetical protein
MGGDFADQQEQQEQQDAMGLMDYTEVKDLAENVVPQE